MITTKKNHTVAIGTVCHAHSTVCDREHTAHVSQILKSNSCAYKLQNEIIHPKVLPECKLSKDFM